MLLGRLENRMVMLVAALFCSLLFYAPTPALAQQDSTELEKEIEKVEAEEAEKVDLSVSFEPEPLKKPWFADLPDDLMKDRLACIQKDIKLTSNRTIKGFINYFTVRKPNYCLVMERRRHVYFPIFEPILKKHGIPEEMKYLAIVESGLNPRAVSRVGAVGLWQFMPVTGKQFGLMINDYIDERMDPYKSTEAACKYLKLAYSIFKDWELSIASYNCGMGHVRRSIRRSGYADGFWEVYEFLPKETRSYVPQFVAVDYTMNYLKENNIIADSLEAPIDFDTIRFTHQHVDLDVLCQQLGVCAEEFLKLNPAIKKNYLPYYLSYPIRIPRDRMPVYYANRAAIADSCSINRSSDNSAVETPLLLAMTEKKTSSTPTTSPVEAKKKQKTTYTVKRGDNLGSIADKYNVTIADLRKWNGIKGNSLKSGRKLIVYRTVKASGASNSGSKTTVVKKSTKSKKSIIHYVQPGDTLWNIAQKYEGVTVEQIKKLNRLKSNELKIGMKLILG